MDYNKEKSMISKHQVLSKFIRFARAIFMKLIILTNHIREKLFTYISKK